MAPWWPFAGVAAAALTVERRLVGGAVRLVMPWQVAVRVAALVVVIATLPLPPLAGGGLGVPALPAVAAGVGTVAAVVNNLPASVWAASLLTAGPTAYAASIGLGIGAMATAHGSVATVVAEDLSGGARDLVSARRLAPWRRRAWLPHARCSPCRSDPPARPPRGLPSGACRPSPRSSR